MSRLEIAAAILVLVAIVGVPVAAFAYDSFRQSSFDGQVIDLTGAHGTWSRGTIRVKQGEKVRLRLTSNDVVHGFALKAYGIEVDEVYPGKVKTIEFVADKPGTFLFACTVICSFNHRHMEGELIVEAQGGQPVVLAEE